jgi:hypothetical protein
MNWQKYWVAAVSGCALLATVLDVQAVELQQCEWLSDQAYSQAWQRDAGVTFPQLRVAIRQGSERPEVKQGLIALSRYVYSHREKSPDDMADDILADCRSYDQ